MADQPPIQGQLARILRLTSRISSRSEEAIRLERDFITNYGRQVHCACTQYLVL